MNAIRAAVLIDAVALATAFALSALAVPAAPGSFNVSPSVVAGQPLPLAIPTAGLNGACTCSPLTCPPGEMCPMISANTTQP